MIVRSHVCPLGEQQMILTCEPSLQLLHLTFCPSSTCAVLVGLDHPQLNREASVNMEGQVHEVGTLIVLDCQASVQGSGDPTALCGFGIMPQHHLISVLEQICHLSSQMTM